ncbi:MAG: sigma-54-dependent Fis family transcriptional regulator [Candidatus Hydrogenedentes bacterium]|nr:sigma-54-dependent Fis family transcriptional regulator [Candidatus Hydrogenedentota bacterium]
MAKKADRSRILVVDDSPLTLEVLQRNLSAEGYDVLTAPGVAGAAELLKSVKVDLVITDLKMPKVSGMDLVRHVRENYRDTEVMMITGYPSIEGAVQAIKTGAEEYVAKPFTDAELSAAVKRALEKLRVRRFGNSAGMPAATMRHGLLGESEAMRKILRAVRKAASTSATVLITGESGTGKELVARAIHYGSARSAAPFVPVNCGGIPDGLLESELFGHVKGAFTGATEARAGFFHSADGGTIFLDEVSETSVPMQVKLLRVLQDKEVCMVGSSRARKVDVRIVAATNKDLLGLVKKDAFRKDLFYRLNVITLVLPPLRERGEDILLLARHFARRFAAELGRTEPRFSDRSMAVLRNYEWPGNVRELENVVQRLVLMTDGDIIDAPDLPPLMRFSPLSRTGLDRTLAEVEAEYVSNVLASLGGNKTQAAKILGIDRKTLRDKVTAVLDGQGDSPKPGQR